MQTHSTTIIYNVSENINEERDAAGSIGLWELPKMLWAGILLFSANLIITSIILVSPEMTVDIYGEAAVGVIAAGTKASPFVVDPAKPRPVRTAVKLRPIVESNPENIMSNDSYLEAMPVSTASAMFGRPVSYHVKTAAYVSGEKLSERVEQESELSRYSALPKDTLPLVRTSVTEVTPHRSSAQVVVGSVMVN